MNRTELIGIVARRTGLGRPAASAAVLAALETIATGIAAGETVTLTGFGTFRTVSTLPRPARNPRTGETVQVPAGRKIGFRPSAALREVLAR